MRRLLALFSVFVGLTALSVAPAAQPVRPPLEVAEFQWLGTPPFSIRSLTTSSVNAQGLVAVTVRDLFDLRIFSGGVHDGTGWVDSRPAAVFRAINDAGDLAAHLQFTSPFLWTLALRDGDGAPHDETVSTTASDVNADGVVVGTRRVRAVGVDRPFVWDTDGFRLMTGLVGDSKGVAVNDSGFVLTRYIESDAVGADRFQLTAPDGSVTTLPLFQTFASVTDMNNAGHLTGEMLNETASLDIGFFWDGATAHPLPLLPGDGAFTRGEGLNDFDQIVGFSRDCAAPPDGCDRAVLWQDGVAHALTDLAVPFIGLDAVLDQAHDITNNGWVVGTGFPGGGLPQQFFRLRLGRSVAFVVTDAGDDPDDDVGDGACATDGGVCTLRAAIEEANATDAASDPPAITFSIASGDAILPATPLPSLARAMTLDGTTQPGSFVALDGTAVASADASGLRVTAAGVTVRGLAVTGFPGYGIDVDGAAGVRLAGNRLGVGLDGVPAANALGSLRVDGDAAIGDRDGTPADRNVLFGPLVVAPGAAARVYLNQMEVDTPDAAGLALRAPLDVGDDGPTCGAWVRSPDAPPAPPRVLDLTAASVRGLSAPGDTVMVYRVADLGSGNGRYWARRVEPLAVAVADGAGAFEASLPGGGGGDFQVAPGDVIALTALAPDGRTSELSQARRPVIFAPGIGGTWLRSSSGEDLWIPLAFGSDAKNERMRRIAMQPGGTTSAEPIAATEVLEEVLGSRTIYGPVHDHLNAIGYAGHPFNENAPLLDQWRFANDWRRSAAVLATDFHALVDRITTASGQTAQSAARACQTDVIAHSNGGVIASVYLRREAAHARDRVHRFVTTGTPYLGADQALAAHTAGYVFGADESLGSGLGGAVTGGWDVAWGDMIAMVRDVPGAYGLMPSRAYYEAMNPATPTYAHGYSLVDLFNEPLVGYDATTNFLTDPKTELGVLALGLGRSALLRLDQEATVHAVIADWRTYEGPPHVFRHVGQLAGSTAVGWFMGPGPEFIGETETTRSEAGDVNRHRVYRERLRPILGFGDHTVPLLSATLGRSPLVGDTDLSGVDESAWIEDFEVYACEHGPLVAPGCRPLDGDGPDALDRLTEILATGSVVPTGGGGGGGGRPAGTTREVVYVMATAPVAVTLADVDGRVTGPRDPDAPGDVAYEVPGVAYRASRLGATLSAPTALGGTLVVRSAHPDAVVTVLRQRHGASGITQILFPDQPLGDGGTLALGLAAGGTTDAAVWALDADGDGTPEGTLAPAAILTDAAAVPAIPLPQPSRVEAAAAGSADVRTVRLRLPDTGTSGWTFTLAGGAPWLALSSTAGSAPADVTLTLDPAGLPPGAVETTLALTLANGGYATTRSVPVRLTVGAAPDVTIARLRPADPTVEVGADGGEVRIRVEMRNTTAASLATQTWVTVTRPDGSRADQRRAPLLELAPGLPVGRGAKILFAPDAPAGTYLVTRYVGTRGVDTLATLAYPVVKAGSPGGGALSADHGPVDLIVRIGADGVAFLDGDDAPVATTLDVPVPNPARGAVEVRFALAEASPVRIEVVDALGRTVAVPVEGERPPGLHAVRVDASRLAPGVYVLRLSAGAVTSTRRLTLIR